MVPVVESAEQAAMLVAATRTHLLSNAAMALVSRFKS
jgi:2-keto-3-deoxy-L-rhamnonate aldolase RhmA